MELVEGTDFGESFNVANLFRMNTGMKKRPYRFFSLRHVVKQLLGEDIQEKDHDPVIDATYAMRVFHRFRYLQENMAHCSSVLQTLARAPVTKSFSQRIPFIDGVALSKQSSINQKNAAVITHAE